MNTKQVRTKWGRVACLVALAAAPLWAQESISERVKKLLDVPPPKDAQEPKSKGGFELTASGRLDFHARNLEVAEALAQLRRLLKRNIVVDPAVKARFTGDLYGVTLNDALDAICRSAGLVHRREGALLIVEPDRPQTRIFKTDYVRAADLVLLLEPLLGSGGKLTATTPAQGGIEASESEAGGDTYASAEVLLAYDLPRNLDRIAKAVRTLDVRPAQVLIEATILSIDRTHDRGVGVDWTALSGVDFRGLNADSPGGTSIGLGSIPLASLDGSIASTGVDLLRNFKDGGLTVGLLKNSVAVFVRALSERTSTKVLANPKVLVLNKQRGQVVVGRRDGFLTTTVTQTSTVQEVEFLETGTRLLFRPFVGSDGFIRLEIHPEDSDGGVNAAGLPFKETAEVTTNILIRDGQTIVIGGLFRERVADTKQRVPGLARVPVLGHLFRSRMETVKREELLIILKARVVDMEDDGKDPRRRLAAMAERRLGQRAPVAPRVADGSVDARIRDLARGEDKEQR